MDLVLTILFGGIFLILAIWAYFLKRKEQRLANVEWKQDFLSLGDNAESHIFELLKELGCNPKYTDEETPRISFKYQGQSFVIASKGRPYSMIWSYAWGALDLPDPMVSLLEISVNYANACGPYVTHYYIDKDSSSMRLITTRMLHIPDGCYDLKEYLVSALDGFFSVQNRIRDMYEDMKRHKPAEQEQEVANSRGVWN